MTEAPHSHPQAHVHPHSRAALELRFGANYRWRVLLAVMVGTMASIMASTIINVAVPDISRIFHLGQERAQWLSAGFMAAMTLSMLTTPWLLARFGYRRTYVGVVVMLGFGGIVGGSSPWFDLVLAMRIVEGLAAGVLQPIPAIVVMRQFEPHERGKAMGIFGFGVVLAPAVGPSVGGVLVEWFGWRSIFFVVVPFCVGAVLLARRYLPVHGPDDTPARRGARLDVTGLALLAAVLMTLLNGMVALRSAEPRTGAALLAVSAITSAAFAVHQRRAAQPLMEVRLFGYRAFSMGSVVAFIYGMALFGSTYLVPVFMQLALHLPPSQAGAVLLPAGFVLALTIPTAGRLVDRVPINRIVATGLLLLTSSFLLMVTIGPATALFWIALWAAIGRVGLGCVLPSLNLGSMYGLPDNFIPQGASTINFMRQLGGAIGISLTGIVLGWRLQERADDPVRAFHETFAFIGALTACAVAAAWRMGGGTGPASPHP